MNKLEDLKGILETYKENLEKHAETATFSSEREKALMGAFLRGSKETIEAIQIWIES